MLLPFVAIGLRLTQGFLTGRGDEVLAVAQFDAPLLEQVIARLGEHDVLGLLLDGARHIDRVLGRGQTACGADFAVNAGHQAGIHGHDAFARQRGTTASIEFGSILHDTNGRADGILGRSALFQQRIAGFKALFRSCSTWARRSGVSFLPRLPAPAWITRRIPSGSAGQPGPSTAAMLLRLLTSSLLQISRLCLTFADILRRWRQRSARHVQKRCRRAVTQSKTYRSATASFLAFHTFANRNLVFHGAPPLVVPVCVKRIVPRTKSRS